MYDQSDCLMSTTAAAAASVGTQAATYAENNHPRSISSNTAKSKGQRTYAFSFWQTVDDLGRLDESGEPFPHIPVPIPCIAAHLTKSHDNVFQRSQSVGFHENLLRYPFGLAITTAGSDMRVRKNVFRDCAPFGPTCVPNEQHDSDNV